MGLQDFFRGVNQGADLQYSIENRSRKLAEQDLALAGLQQAYADEMTLKPLRLNNIMSELNYQTNKNKLDLSSLLQKRPLEDKRDLAKLNAFFVKHPLELERDRLKIKGEVDENQLKNDVFAKTRGAQEQTKINTIKSAADNAEYNAIKSGISLGVAKDKKETLTKTEGLIVDAAEKQAQTTVKEYAVNDAKEIIRNDVAENGIQALKKYLKSSDPIQRSAVSAVIETMGKNKGENGAVMKAKQDRENENAFANILSNVGTRFIQRKDGLYYDTQTGELLNEYGAIYRASNGNGAAMRDYYKLQFQGAINGDGYKATDSTLAQVLAKQNGWQIKDGKFYDAQGNPVSDKDVLLKREQIMEMFNE